MAKVSYEVTVDQEAPRIGLLVSLDGQPVVESWHTPGELDVLIRVLSRARDSLRPDPGAPAEGGGSEPREGMERAVRLLAQAGESFVTEMLALHAAAEDDPRWSALTRDAVARLRERCAQLAQVLEPARALGEGKRFERKVS